MKGEDIIPLVVLGGGLFLLGKASKRPPRKIEDRTGESCDPNDIAPFGYEGAQVRGGWKPVPEKPQWLGFGHYNNRAGVDEAIHSLGFPDGDLSGFQEYMSRISEWDLREDGEVDKGTILALEEADRMLRLDEWVFPGELG